jgi:hypothetical protein
MGRTTQQFGITLSYLDTSTPGVLLYGVTPDNNVIPIQIDEHGVLNSNVTLIGDIVVGSFVIQDPINAGRKANVIFDGTNNALVISADSLPLPTGAATEATLLNLDSKFNTLGQKTSAESVPVVLASDQLPLPVSATFSGSISVGTVNQGLPAGVTQAWPVQFSDGIHFVNAADYADNALRVAIVSGLSNTLFTRDAADGLPGFPVPTYAIQIAGENTSGNLQTIATDLSGNVGVNIENIPTVSVNNFPANQTISGTVSVVQPVTILASSNSGLTINGNVNIQAISASGLTINGTVTANQGTPALVANAWPIEITNGIASAAIENFSPSGTEFGLVVRNIPSGTQPVSGSVSVSNFPANQTISGTVSVNQPLTVLASSVSGLTINGTVTANIGNEPITVLSSSSSGLTINGTISALQSGGWTVSLSTESIEIGKVDQGSPNGITNAWPVELTNGTLVATLRTASAAYVTDSALVVEPSPIRPNTYSAAVFSSGIATPTFVSYFFVIQGSATKTVRITKLSLSGTATTGGQKVFGAYRGTGISGGTPTVLVIQTHDSTNAAATATATQYASGSTPTFADTGPIRSWTLFMPALASVTAPGVIYETFGNGPDQEIILRSTNEVFALTLVGGAIAGAAMNAYIEWTEE